MTILDFLQTHTLEEILQNDKMVKKLDPPERTYRENRSVDCDLSDFCGFLERNVCMRSNCEFYTYHGYDCKTDMCYWSCNITEQTAIKNGWNGLSGELSNFQFPLKKIKCPYLEKHKEYIRNWIKDNLLEEIGE